MKYKIKSMTFFLFIILMCFASPALLAQIPEGIPNDPNSLNLESDQQKFWYLIIPVIILAIATIWYYKRATNKSQN